MLCHAACKRNIKGKFIQIYPDLSSFVCNVAVRHTCYSTLCSVVFSVLLTSLELLKEHLALATCMAGRILLSLAHKFTAAWVHCVRGQVTKSKNHGTVSAGKVNFFEKQDFYELLHPNIEVFQNLGEWQIHLEWDGRRMASPLLLHYKRYKITLNGGKVTLAVDFKKSIIEHILFE